MKFTPISKCPACGAPVDELPDPTDDREAVGLMCPHCRAPVSHDGSHLAAPPDDGGGDDGAYAAADSDRADGGAIDDDTMAAISAAVETYDEEAVAQLDEPAADPFQHDGYDAATLARAHQLRRDSPQLGLNGVRAKLNTERESAARSAADLVRRGASASPSQERIAALVERHARRYQSEANLDYATATRRALRELTPSDRRRYERGR